MKKKTILFLIPLMIPLLLSSAQATAPIDLGTILYKGNTVLLINQTHEVNLTILYEPIPVSIIYNKLGFNPVTNQTAYSFLSLILPVDHTFINNTKTCLFQDTATKQVYRLYINYTSITVPSDPVHINYTILQGRYNNTYNNYTRVNNSLANLTAAFNLTYANLNTSLNNMTKKHNSTMEQLLSMSLNLSLAQCTINTLYREKESLKTEILITQVTAILLILFFSILTLFIAKKFGWLNKTPDEDRKLKRLRSGCSDLIKKYDDYIVRTNDEITKKRNEKNEKKPVEQKTISYTKEKTDDPTYEEAEKFIDKLPTTKKEIPPEQLKEQTGEQMTLLSQGQIIKKMLNEGATPEQIIETTGFNSQYVNIITKKHLG